MNASSLNIPGYVPVLVVLCASIAVGDDFQEGIDAFNKQDYSTALAAWMPLAQDGDLNAWLEECENASSDL